MHNVHITPTLSDASRGIRLSHSSYYSQDGSLPIYDRYVSRVRYVDGGNLTGSSADIIGCLYVYIESRHRNGPLFK